MNVDPSEHIVISLTVLLAAAISGAVIGATYGGVTAAANGQNIWAGILVGAGAGALMGVGAAVASAFIVPVIFGTAYYYSDLKKFNNDNEITIRARIILY